MARIFWDFGEERESRRLARAIETQRNARPFETTRQLADFIESQMPRRGKRVHPATKIFQALRIEVNRELEVLREGLEAAWDSLRIGGRLAVITFHSLEDRIVKEFGRLLSREYDLRGDADIPEYRVPRQPYARLLSRKAISATEQEMLENPRSRSAHLRAMEKLAEAA